MLLGPASCRKSLTAGIIFFHSSKVENFKDHKLLERLNALKSADIHSFGQLESAADVLDEYYIETRYPNCWPRGTLPADQYDENKAKEALDFAG